jgi:hypothetical protein
MAGAKELYAVTEACGEANIKAWEDLSKQAIALAHREPVVEEREQEVQEKEEEITDMLDLERSKLSSHKADLNTSEATLEADEKSLRDLHVEVLAHELTTDLKANHLEFRE